MNDDELMDLLARGAPAEDERFVGAVMERILAEAQARAARNQVILLAGVGLCAVIGGPVLAAWTPSIAVLAAGAAIGAWAWAEAT